MPTYDYLCEKGHEFSSTQSIKDDPITKCEYEVADDRKGPVFCDAPCKRQIGNTSFKFKGGSPTPKHY